MINRKMAGWYIRFYITKWHQLTHKPTRFMCGHSSTRKAVVVFQEKRMMCKLDSDNDHTYCPQCLVDAATRCAKCNMIIMPLAQVSLATPNPEDELSPNATWRDNGVILCATCSPEDAPAKVWGISGEIEEPERSGGKATSST